MPHLKFHGKVLKQYHGIDKDTVVVAGAGDVIHVSEEKADRLLKDFPTEFEVHHTGGAKGKEAPEDSAADSDLDMEQDPPKVESKEAEPPKNKMVGKAKKSKAKKDKWQ